MSWLPFGGVETQPKHSKTARNLQIFIGHVLINFPTLGLSLLPRCLFLLLIGDLVSGVSLEDEHSSGGKMSGFQFSEKILFYASFQSFPGYFTHLLLSFLPLLLPNSLDPLLLNTGSTPTNLTPVNPPSPDNTITSSNPPTPSKDPSAK